LNNENKINTTTSPSPLSFAEKSMFRLIGQGIRKTLEK
jgi:hypothetical protein